MKLNFDKLFIIPTKTLIFNRCHPHIKRDKKWLLQCILMQGYFTFVFLFIFYNIIHYDLKNQNFTQTCKNGVMVIVYLVSTLQYCILICHQTSLAKLIDNVNKDYEITQHLTITEQKIVKKYAREGISVCKQWLFISVIGTASFIIRMVVLMTYYYIINDFKLVHFYDLTYPDIIEENKENIIGYLGTFIFLLLFGIYSSNMYAAYVPIGPIMMLHACGQLEIVKIKIDCLFEELDSEIIEMKLREIIEQLQYIYGFVETIKDVFKIAYEFTLKATTLLLPITFHEVIQATNKGELSMEFITFIVGGFLISSTPCYYSDLLMEKGEKVRLSIYTCGWESHYDQRTRTTIQILLLNALRPIAIRAVFRTLCLEALTDLFQQSYAIFNLMNAVWS